MAEQEGISKQIGIGVGEREWDENEKNPKYDPKRSEMSVRVL